MKQKVSSTKSESSFKVSIKSKTPSPANSETCHVCDGKGYVPKSWYRSPRTKK